MSLSRRLGYRTARLQSDGEPSIVALKTAALLASPFVELVLHENPVGEHATNGVAESAMREVKRQTRTLKFALEAHVEKIVEPHSILKWIPTMAADAVSFCRIWRDCLKARTGSVLIMTTDGVVKAAGFRRMNEKSRWNIENWNSLRGLCRDVTETAAEATEAIQAPRPQIVHLLVTPRRSYVTRADLRKYGVTIGCLAYSDIAVHGKTSKPSQGRVPK